MHITRINQIFFITNSLHGSTLFVKKPHSFLTQQLNLFYPLKDSRNLLISKFPWVPVNPSWSFLKCFIIFTSYLILLYFFYSYLFPGILEFWHLATKTFKFIVLYNNIYRKKSPISHVLLGLSLFWKPWLLPLVKLLTKLSKTCEHLRLPTEKKS